MILINFIQLSITRYEETKKERQGIERVYNWIKIRANYWSWRGYNKIV